MKKIVILFSAIFINTIGFAQRPSMVTAEPVHSFDPYHIISSAGDPHAKTTATGDTLTLKHITAADTIAIYRVSSGGYATGTNAWNDKAFAERYDYNDDTGKNMKVIGCFAQFHGKINPASTKTATLKLWSEGPGQYITGSKSFRGFPGSLMDSLSVPVTQLGIGTATDTLKKFMFPDDGHYYSAFFIGYSIDYNFADLSGDTLGLVCSKNGERHPAFTYSLVYNVSDFGDTVLDTVINVQNATLESNNTWYDNYTQNDSLFNNLAIYPIIVMGHTAGVNGVKRNGLTFYGSYPNPAVNIANISFSLTANANVTVQLMDMNGRVINTATQVGLSTGSHTIPLDISALPVGEYLYLLRTSAGDGIAGKLVKE